MAIARRLALAVLVAALSFPTAEVLAETTLRVFVGGQQRPDVMRPLLDLYQQRNHGVKVELEVGWDRVYAVAARTFADARPGDLVVYEDAYRNIALAINRGSAAQMLRVTVGQEIRLAHAS